MILETKCNGKTVKTFAYNLDEGDIENIILNVEELEENYEENDEGDDNSEKLNDEIVNETGIFYELNIYYHALPTKVIKGAYIMDFMPDGWKDFLDALGEIPYLMGTSEIIANPAVLPNKYIYCSVAFGDDDNTWYYRTEDKTFKEGDYVAVPWGKNNKKRFGCIKKIEYFKEFDVPFPIEQTKLILFRASSEDFEKDTYDTLSYEFQKLMKNFEWRQNEFITERWNEFKFTLKKLGYDKAKYLDYTKGRKLEYSINEIGSASLQECCAWLSWIMWGDIFQEGVFKKCLYNGYVDILLKRVCDILDKK